MSKLVQAINGLALFVASTAVSMAQIDCGGGIFAETTCPGGGGDTGGTGGDVSNLASPEVLALIAGSVVVAIAISRLRRK